MPPPSSAATLISAPGAAKTAIGQLAQSLPMLVAGQLLTAILDGTLAPGTRLTEIELAQEHAVSRATIREALAQLERQHFVERVPRYGARVAAVSNDEVLEIYQLRAVVFGLASRLACKNRQGDEIQALDAAVAQMESLASKRSTKATTYMEHSVAAQHQVLEIARSRRVAQMYDQLTNLTLWLSAIRQTGLGFATAERRRDSARDWRTLANALLSGNEQASEKAACALMTASGQYVWQRLQETKRR